jgi:hypothetical protein
LKIKIFDLEFDADFYYIQRDSIVETIKVNNRTFYSKFEKIDTPPTPLLIKQHLNRDFTIALPLITNNINYIVLEYRDDESNHFFYILKYLLKSLYITEFYTYRGVHKGTIQTFIPVKELNLEDTYKEIEKIKQILDFKLIKRYKILPDKNLPENYNKITLPIKKM